MTFYEAINSPQINLWGSMFQLVLSLVLGSVLGFERRRRGQSAGVRTFSLISMGSALAMILSIYVSQHWAPELSGDPTRIAAGVLSGIGFLGAGAIIQMKGSVRGLTTAAGIWMVSCIGMAVGCGLYLVATAATMLALFVFVWLERIERRVSMPSESRIIRVRLATILRDVDKYRRVLDTFHGQLNNFYVDYDYDLNETRLNLVVVLRADTDLPDLFNAFRELYPTKSITLANQINI